MDMLEQTFTFEVSSKPDLINVDAEKMLLTYKYYDNKAIDEWIYQYQHAPLFLDRWESIEWLASEQVAESKAARIIEDALNDKHWAIRQFALDTILINSSTSQQIKDKIMSMVVNDEKSYVRASAISRLSDLNMDVSSLLNQALNDKSYTVIGSAINAIYETDKSRGLDIAHQNMNEENENIKYSVMNILAAEGSAKDNDYFIKKLEDASGFKSYYVMMFYEPYLERMNDFSIIQKGVDALKKVATDMENPWMAYTANSSLISMKSAYESDIQSADAQQKSTYQQAINYIDNVLNEISNEMSSD